MRALGIQNNTAILILTLRSQREKANGRFFPVYLHKHTYTYTSVYAPMCACVENEELERSVRVCVFVRDLSGEE